MATRQIDRSAAKAKKQKTILIVMGVVMLALAAIQGPKLWKQLNPSTPAAVPAPSDTSGTTPATTTPAATGQTSGSAGTGPTALLAGVTIEAPGKPATDQSQLRSFTLFEPKDPFVPQASDELPGTTTPTAEPTLSGTQPGAISGNDAGAGDGGGSTAAGAKPEESQPTYVTISLNGKVYPLAAKEFFPSGNPLFVVASVKPEVVRIGVAGGSFADGKTVPLKMSKKLILVNEATGARYVLKLLYTGTSPEQVESFTQAKK
jgi:hypothetical protein